MHKIQLFAGRGSIKLYTIWFHHHSLSWSEVAVNNEQEASREEVWLGRRRNRRGRFRQERRGPSKRRVHRLRRYQVQVQPKALRYQGVRLWRLHLPFLDAQKAYQLPWFKHSNSTPILQLGVCLNLAGAPRYWPSDQRLKANVNFH